MLIVKYVCAVYAKKKKRDTTGSSANDYFRVVFQLLYEHIVKWLCIIRDPHFT